MHYGNDKLAAVMATAAGDVVKLIVADFAVLRMKQIVICLRTLFGHFHAVFVGKSYELLGGLRVFRFRKQFLVQFHCQNPPFVFV
ncbi:unknown [Ruminococcus sp. CAG:382]|nr:unknown [Ruminococcus sp. CAG:382]